MTHYKVRTMLYNDILIRVRDALSYSNSEGYREAVNSLTTGAVVRNYLNGNEAPLSTEQQRRADAALATIHAFILGNGVARVYVNQEPAMEGAYRTVPTLTGGYFIHYLPGSAGDGERISIPLNWFGGTVDELPDQAQSNVVLTPLTGWGEGYSEVRPTDELLERLPQSMRALATVTIAATGNTANTYLNAETGEFTRIQERNGEIPTGESLIATAREAYRSMIRMRMQRPNQETEEAERIAREAHREQTRRNWERYAAREADTEQHVATLPFVPHGLSSSRRWGIEVESGGARGVDTPEGWRGVSDGSLRSAYDGWTEVQDFEPYDREETSRIYWEGCENAGRHNPRVEVYDSVREEYFYEPNPDYISPRECDACGSVTRTVRVEPQTVTHRAQAGDCREFVSPILVSMHSKGLEYLTTELSKRPQNNSAGVHVHVEASDLSREQLATLVFGYDVLEPLLEASYQRDRRDYCHRRDASDVLSAARSARTGGIDPDSGDRYVTLNTHSINRHGTVEFRAMGPVYNYEYLTRWAMLCRELVNSVAAGAKPKDFANIKTWQDLLNFMSKFGKEYVRAAVYEMTGETGTAATLVKGDQPVTNEALDADLEAILTGISLTPEQIRAFGAAINQVGVSASQLVGVGGLAEV